MNILLIGNGFDLAHGLPTKYMDFLDFTKDYMECYEKEIKNSDPIWEADSEAKKYIRKLFDAKYVNNSDNFKEKEAAKKE